MKRNNNPLERTKTDFVDLAKEIDRLGEAAKKAEWSMHETTLVLILSEHIMLRQEFRKTIDRIIEH